MPSSRPNKRAPFWRSKMEQFWAVHIARAGLSAEDFKGMEQQIKDLSAQVGCLFPHEESSKSKKAMAPIEVRLG